MNFKYVIFTALFLSANSFAITWVGVTSKVKMVGTSWTDDKVCVHLESGDVAKIDISTDIGKLKSSLAIAAQMSGKNLRIQFNLDGMLEGGCSTGTTIKPHSVIQVKD